MIKLIVSDIDGTLIPEGEQELDAEFLEVLDILLRKGCEFYAASGRQYPSMYRLFGKYADRIGFICENGGLALEQGCQLYVQEIPREKMLAVAADIMAFPEAEILLSGIKVCYMKPRTDWYENQILHVLKYKGVHFERCEEIQEPIVKIAMYIHDFEKNRWKIQKTLMEKHGDFANFLVSGNGWLDMICKNAGKGVALRAIMEKKRICPEEIMVFGDNQNDISMLKVTENSFAMANAKPDVQACAKYICENVAEFLKKQIPNWP